MATAEIRATRLRCEYLSNPLGMQEVAPRLCWWVEDGRAGARQSAYRVRCASSVTKLASPDHGDTGRVASGEQAHIAAPVRSLASRQRVYWDVTLWDEAGAEGRPSEAAWFEMGLLSREEWKAEFIATPIMGAGRTSPPVPILRKGFELPAGVAEARLYITALGLYEAEINGRRVGSDWFRPGWTDYNHRLQYQTYDVTEHLAAGRNAIGAWLGDGWYCGRVAHLDRAVRYGEKPALMAQLEVRCTDGSVHRICTDESWRWAESAIRSSDFLAGEEYDARREIGGWSGAAFDDRGWSTVEKHPWPGVALEASPAEPVHEVATLEPVGEPKAIPADWGRKAYLFDFGQNFTGNVRLKVRGPRGCTLQLRYAEVLTPGGRVDVSNLRSARAVDTYTLRGDGDDVWTPRFTFHGFRYVEVTAPESWFSPREGSGVLAPLTRGSLTGLALASDTGTTGTFETDHALLNRLQQNIVWGQRSNFLEIPTDCPQRDERLGWTGDAQVFAPTAAFNMDVAAFFTKWMWDVDDAQLPDGGVPCIAPVLFEKEDGGPGWSDARVVIPLAMYEAYGDRRMLERHYAPMRRWMEHHIATSRDGLRCMPDMPGFHGFGDWLALDGDGIDPFRNATPKELVATAYFARALAVMKEIALVLGRGEDAERYGQMRETVGAAFVREFFSGSGRSVAASQTSYAMALGFDLLPEPMRPAALANFVRLIAERGDHLSTGFLGTPLLCPTLTRFGRMDVAYKLLFQTTYPSWLYPVSIGATTMWERWNSWHPDKGFVDLSMNSLNHYAYGAIGEWMYGTIAGISAMEPGYRRVRIAPRPGGPIRHCRASLDTLHGPVSVEWRIEGEKGTSGERLRLTVRLAANMSGECVMPDGSRRTLSAGVHEVQSGMGS